MGCYRDEPERSVWGVGTGGLEAGKLGGGTLREVGAGKSGRWEFSKGGSGRTREKIRNLISRSQKGLREGSQEKWGRSRENKVRDVLPLCPFPHGFQRVLSKSLLVHALGSKKS